jgi:2-polyprenyl-6-methoxyphenol hydroxylase-like FAD-dependent oxidoreductase
MVHPPRGAFERPNTIAYQRFLPTGPIAFLPLSPTASSLVWSTRPHLASALTASEPAVLASMINAAFRLPEVSLRYLHDRIIEAQAKGIPLRHSEVQEEILWREQSHAIDTNSAYSCVITNTGGNVGVPPADSELLPPLVTSIQAGTVASFPLRFNHTESYIGEGRGSRTVLIGDAAHTVHPLAGQGLNMGLADAECLAKCIEQAVLQGGDVGQLAYMFLDRVSDRHFYDLRFPHRSSTLRSRKIFAKPHPHGSNRQASQTVFYHVGAVGLGKVCWGRGSKRAGFRESSPYDDSWSAKAHSRWGNCMESGRERGGNSGYEC